MLNRHGKLLGEIVRLFLTQQELCKYYSIIENRNVGDEVDKALSILSGNADILEPGDFFRGFLVKAFNKLLNAFILVPIHTVHRNGKHGDLEVELWMHERDGSLVSCMLPAKDLWPTHPEFQERADKEQGKLLADGDLYYVVAMTELRGDQYLFPVATRVVAIRKHLLRCLATLAELRRKQERRDWHLQRAEEVEVKIEAALGELNVMQVGGQYRVPNEAEKDMIWARVYKLREELTGFRESATAVGFDDQALQDAERKVESWLEGLQNAVHEAELEIRDVAAELKSATPRGQGQRDAGVAWPTSSPVPLDPRRFGGGGFGIGSAGDGMEEAAVTMAAAAATRGSPVGAGLLHSPRGAAAHGCETPPSAKRPRLQPASEGGRSPQPTKLQIDFMRLQAEVLWLLTTNDAVKMDGTEDWSRLPEAQAEQASELNRRCQALEAQLLEAGQALPSQVQVAQVYAALSRERRHELQQGQIGQQGAHAAQASVWNEQQQQQQEHATQSRPHRQHSSSSRQTGSTRSDAGHHRGGQQHQHHEAAVRRPRLAGDKWCGNFALGESGLVVADLKSGRISVAPMPMRGANVSTSSTFSDLKNTWIPLVYPVVTPVPDLKELIPEIGVLTFDNPDELSSMRRFGDRHGWYTDVASAGPRPNPGRTCIKSSVEFRDGHLAGREMVVYLFTNKNRWAREALVDSLSDRQKEQFAANEAFLVLVRLGPRKGAAEANRSAAVSQSRGSVGRDRPEAATPVGVPACPAANVVHSAAGAQPQPADHPALAPVAPSAAVRAATAEPGCDVPAAVQDPRSGCAVEGQPDPVAMMIAPSALPVLGATPASDEAVGAQTEAPVLAAAVRMPAAPPAQPEASAQPEPAAAQPGTLHAAAGGMDGQSTSGAALSAAPHQPHLEHQQQQQQQQQQQPPQPPQPPQTSQPPQPTQPTQPTQPPQPQQPQQPALDMTAYPTAYHPWGAPQGAYGAHPQAYPSYASYHSQYDPAAAYSAAAQHSYYSSASYHPSYSYGWSWQAWPDYGAAPRSHWPPPEAAVGAASHAYASTALAAAPENAQPQAASATVTEKAALAQAPWRALDAPQPQPMAEVSGMSISDEAAQPDKGGKEEEVVSKNQQLVSGAVGHGAVALGHGAASPAAQVPDGSVAAQTSAGQPRMGVEPPPLPSLPPPQPPPPPQQQQQLAAERAAGVARRASPEPQEHPQPSAANEQPEREPSPQFSFGSDEDDDE